MEPRLRAALTQLALSAPDKGMQAEIVAYVQTNGGSPLSPRTFGYVQTQLRPMNLSVSPPGGATGNITPPPTPAGQPAAPMAPEGPPPPQVAGARGNVRGATDTLARQGAPPDVGANSIDVNPANLPPRTVDEFGRPTEQNYQERVARDVAAVGQQAQAGAGGGGAQPPADATAAANAPAPAVGDESTQAAQDIAVSSLQGEPLAAMALKAAGIDLTRPGLFGRQIAQFLLPLLNARRASYGLAGGGTGMQGVGGLTQDLLNFAMGLTHGGGKGFFSNAQDYARQVAGSPGFAQALQGLESDPEAQQAMLQSIQPLLYAGANPMVAASAAARTKNELLKYQMQQLEALNPAAVAAGAPNQPVFTSYLQSREQNDPFISRLFGRSFR